jgi:hypothetical protein
MKRKRKEELSFRGLALAAGILLVTTAISPIVVSFSAQTTVEIIKESSIIEPNSDTKSLHYTFAFRPPHLHGVKLPEGTFATYSMPGCFLIGSNPGEPMFQVKPIRMLLPQGADVTTVEVITDKIIEIDAKAHGIDLTKTPIFPYQPPVPIGHPPLDFQFDHEIYQSLDKIPEGEHDHFDIGYCRGYAILTLNLYPTQYVPAEGKLWYYPEMTVEVKLTMTGDINQFYRHTNDEDKAWISSLVCNPEVTQTYTQPLVKGTVYSGGLCDPSDNGGLGYDYVIITSEALFDFTVTYTWDDLISRKQLEGLEATKMKVEDIVACPDYWNPDPLFNDTPARIREFCKDAYVDWGTAYILIGGDQDGVNRVERRKMAYLDEPYVESDIYWTHLDNTFNADHDSYWGEEGDSGFDLYSEMYSGSIPCDDETDISNWLTKSFFYADNLEEDYLDNAAFYGGDTGWDCQGDDFIDYSAIKGTDDWLGPIPHSDGPYPTWLGFQYGFETWNSENPGLEYDLSVKWTAEPPNPGWQGGSESAAINGLKNAINNDQCTLISAIAHAYEGMSMDVYDYQWEANYHNTKPFFLHDYGCHCGDMDAADDGVLHSMLFHSDTELAFACVYNTGYGWGNLYSTNSSSALQQKSFWDYMFDTVNNSGSTMNWQLGKAQEWARDLMAPTIDWDPYYGSWRGIIECCLLFGDPAQTIKPPLMPEHNVGVQTLDVSSHVLPDEMVYVNATVVNNGQHNETDVLVSLRINGSEIDNVSIPFFESQTTQDVSFTWTPTLGWYTVTVNISIPSVIEDFYADNEKSKIVIAGPDVAVTSIDVPSYAALGMLTDVEGTIENLGTTDESIDVYLKIDSIVEQSQAIYLDSGANTVVTFHWEPSVVGTYPVEIYAEIAGSEPYMGNNQMSKNVTVIETQGYVLLVDDDDGDSYESYYENALFAGGYLYDVWNRNSQGSPSASTMSDYNAVIWFTGDDYWSTLDSTDQSNLASYLNGGGSLFITGQDIGYDIGDTSFYQNYLHAQYGEDNTNIFTLDGIPGDPIGDGITLGIASGDGANNQNWPSGITPRNPATTVFRYQGSPYYGGIKTDTGAYRVVYFSFGFEAINNFDDRVLVMTRTLGWLIGEYTAPDIWIDPLQFNLIVSPGDSLDETLTIGNDADATADLSFNLEIPHGWVLQWDQLYGGDGHSQLAQPVGDIDEDGVNEVIVGGYASYSAIILSYDSGTETYVQEYEWSQGSGTPSGACVVDLDDNGDLELVVSWEYGYSDGVYAYDWDGSSLTTLGSYSGTGYNFCFDIYACDYDDDSDVEVLIANDIRYGGSYHVTALRWNNGGGGFVREISWGSGSSTECPMIWSGDTDGDGLTEVIALASYSTVYALNYNGDSWSPIVVASGLPNHPYGVAVGDLDNDGVDEIGIGLEYTQAYIYDYNGLSYEQVWYTNYAGEQDIIEATAIGDADNDGQNEFLVGTDDIHVISWNGGGYSEESTILYTDGQLAGTIIGDCDTDGLNEVKANDILSSPGKEWIIEYLPEPAWLSVSPDHGIVVPDDFIDITVTIDATSLTPGTYTSSIIVHSNDFDENPLNIPVNLEVLSGPILSYDPTSHDFGDKHQGITDSTTFEIWNSGSEILEYTLSESSDWVTIDPTNGNSSGEYDPILVTIDTTGLSPDLYTCDVSISSNGGIGEYTIIVNVIQNRPPNKPNTPVGTTVGTPYIEYSYTSSTTDPDGDQVYYMFDWGDGNMSDWLGPFDSGKSLDVSYAWAQHGTYDIRVKAKDDYDGAESEWSDTLGVHIVIRGDANGDGIIDVGDVIFLVNYLYDDGPAPEFFIQGDATNDGILNVADIVFLINYLYRGGSPP